MEIEEMHKKIIEKAKTKIAVSNYLKEDTAIKKNSNIPKMVATIIITIGITTGMTYAGTAIYNRIWKQPERTVGFYDENNNPISTKEEKETTITKEEAEEKAREILKKFGHDNEKIQVVQLKNDIKNFELMWEIETQKKSYVWIDAKGRNKMMISFNNILDGDIKKYRSNKNEAEKTAKELCEKYGYNMDKYNLIEVEYNLNSEEKSYIYSVKFYNEYEGIKNNYEEINISFIPQINKIYYFNVNNINFENNSIVLTEEEAKSISLNAEQKVKTNKNIKSIYTNLDIVQVNGDAYLRINDYNQYKEQSYSNYEKQNYVVYKTENITRKAWSVTVEYEVDENADTFDKYYTYYIDSETGEIIGGNPYYYFTKFFRNN